MTRKCSPVRRTPMELTIEMLSEIVGGRLRLADMPPLGGLWEPVGKLVTDPAQIAQGDVFLALPGAHAQDPFCAQQAFARGALGVIHAGRPVEPWAGRFSIAVADVPWALWQLARAARNEYEGRVVAVAGTIGKSIACAMAHAVLGAGGTAMGTDHDQSDHALSQAMLGLNNDEAFAVFELHSVAKGELDAAVHLCRPHVGVLVHPHERHALRGDVVGAEKKRRPHPHSDHEEDGWDELLQALPDNGGAVVGPDVRFDGAAKLHGKVLTFGRDPRCDVSASHVVCEDGRLSFVVDGQMARLNVWGRHYLDLALAAWGAGRLAGVADRQIAARLENARLPRRRCEVSRRGGVTFIDDTGCRAPLSRRASLALLSGTRSAQRRVVICGSANPQEGARCAAESFGRDVVEVGGADFLIAVGAAADDVLRGALDAGMPRTHCLRCAASEAVAKKISNFLQTGDVVLLKDVDSEAADQVLELFENATQTAAA